MILPIYVYGQPVLRQVADDVDPAMGGLKELVQDMYETLAASDGIGLAAPQVGKPIRVVVIDLDVISDSLPEYKGFKQAYVNPHILEYDDSRMETMEEGCLSLPGIHENVTRPTRIRVGYVDEQGVAHEEWVDGYLARVMQHEFDHLEGKMFVDRISPLRKQLIRNKLKSLLQGRYSCDYKTKASTRRK